MEVLYYDILGISEKAENLGCKYVTLDELLNESDFVSVHLPLNK